MEFKEKAIPGGKLYTPRQAKLRDKMYRSACEAVEMFGEDELERWQEENDPRQREEKEDDETDHR